MNEPTTLAGQVVSVEAVLWEVPNLADQLVEGDFTHNMTKVVVPEGHRSGGTDPATYAGYRRGLDSACADIVVTTRLESGAPAVLAVRRGAKKPFGGCWWMQGGAIHAYRSILDFMREHAKAECGVDVRIQGLIGIYRTCAEDGIASTINLCYAGAASRMAIERAWADADHSEWRLLTLRNIGGLPQAERHWYPMHVFRRVLTACH